MINDTENFWFGLQNSDMWTFWPGHEKDPTYGLFHAGGIVSNEPLLNTMKKVCNSTFKKDVIASALDSRSGNCKVYHLNNMSNE